MSIFSKPGDDPALVFGSTATPEVEAELVPDSATPVYGFRVWTINRVMATLVGTYAAWRPGVNEAKCESSYMGLTITTTGTTTGTRAPAHSAPDPNCRCGYNALDAWEELDIRAGHSGPPQVTTYGSNTTSYSSWIEGNVEDILYPQAPGISKGWGRVALHTGGWRSQFAEIVALIDLCAVLPWFDRDDKFHQLLEYSAKHYGVPILDRIPDLGEFA